MVGRRAVVEPTFLHIIGKATSLAARRLRHPVGVSFGLFCRAMIVGDAPVYPRGIFNPDEIVVNSFNLDDEDPVDAGRR